MQIHGLEAKDELDLSCQEGGVFVSVRLGHLVSLARASQVLLGFGCELPPCWDTFAFLPQTPAAQGDEAWAKAYNSPLIACETSLGFFLTSQKAVTNLLSPPRRPGPARDMLGSEKCFVKNVRKSK